jgi:hypothetical protein
VRRLLPEDYPTPLPINIVYPQTRALSSRARCLIEFLLDELKEQPAAVLKRQGAGADAR